MQEKNNDSKKQKPPVSSSQSFKKNGKITVGTIILIIAVLIGGLGVYFLFRPQVASLNKAKIPPASKNTNGSSSATPVSSIKTIHYSLPQDWQIIKDKTGTFEIGYNPGIQVAQATDSGITIQNNKPDLNVATPITVSLRSYDGPSGRSFIEGQIGEKLSSFNTWPGAKESEYQIQGKSCFFQTGVAISQYPTTWGACILSPTQAMLITTWDNNFEPLLSTLKFYNP